MIYLTNVHSLAQELGGRGGDTFRLGMVTKKNASLNAIHSYTTPLKGERVV